MGKIAVHRVEEIQWKKIRDMAAPGSISVLTAGELDSDIIFHEQGLTPRHSLWK